MPVFDFGYLASHMFTIENAQIKAVINAKGAELTQLFHKGTQLDYLWNGDPTFWGKHSPVLFPTVGELKDKTYFYKGKAYQLGRHGFARERQFVIDSSSKDEVTFLLESDEESRAVYPFDFEFIIKYTLYKSSLTVSYNVLNRGVELMYFSVGAHPAFKLPLVSGTEFSDYYLEFDQAETASRWPISKDGLIETTQIPLLQGTKRLDLSKDLFKKDALVIKGMASTIVHLRSDKTPHGFRFDYPGFPFMGIWSTKNADFVCIEPWCGIADGVNSNQQLEDKEGINELPAGESFTRTWTVTLF